jgi:hypothetical protein
MKSSLIILSDNEYVELMYFSEDILVVISIIFSMDLHHIKKIRKIRKISACLKACFPAPKDFNYLAFISFERT